jgi:MFS family permease
MQFITPEILELARGLSLPLTVAGLALGALLWLTGWWAHRFWIVLTATLLAGLFGLAKGPVLRVQPLLAGLLLAVAAGVLALALVRVVVFAAGGAACWLGVQALAPAPWHEPLVCFLAGGLVGLLLFRWWTMALTSFVASVVMAFFGLLLADSLGKLDAVAVTQQQRVLLNWACGVVSFIGFGVQYVLERRRGKWKAGRLNLEEAYREKRRRPYEEKRPFWSLGRQYRKAG